MFIHQILAKSYKTARQHFCTSFIRKCEKNSDIVKELRYSDETNFHVDDKINSKKFGYWLHGTPDVVAEAPLYSVKITCVIITVQQGRHWALLPRRRQRRHADRQRSAVPGGAGEISEGPQDKAEERYGSPPVLLVPTVILGRCWGSGRAPGVGWRQRCLETEKTCDFDPPAPSPPETTRTETRPSAAPPREVQPRYYAPVDVFPSDYVAVGRGLGWWLSRPMPTWSTGWRWCRRRLAASMTDRWRWCRPLAPTPECFVECSVTSIGAT